MATSQSLDWAQYYGPTATAADDSISASTGPIHPDNPVRHIEGRVGKSSGRRRSRASRRTPTTLLNTDPTNFRAMVQQFTGAPAGSYPSPAGPLISFGYGSGLGQAPVQYQQLNQGAVYTEGGGVCNNGYVQGFNFDVSTTTSTATGSGGVLLDGMGMRGGSANETSGGYLF